MGVDETQGPMITNLFTVEPWPRDWKSPNWENTRRVHDWKNYITEEVQSMWDTFTDDQKKAIARSAEEIADREDWD